jgi:hypothetical protein
MTLQWPDLKEKTGTKVEEITRIVDVNTSMDSATGTIEGVSTTFNESEVETRAIKFILGNKTIFEELAKL